MKRKIVSMVIALGGIGPMTGAALDVVTSTPDLALLAREIGGGNVTVTSLAKGSEDPHFVDPKPSFVPLLRSADLLLQSGADLERAWLLPLTNTAGDARLLRKGSRHIDCGRGIELIRERYGAVDYAIADVHPKGNPHYLLDPVRARRVAATIGEAFAAADPGRAAEYRARAERVGAAIGAAMPRWNGSLAPFKGAAVVTYHASHNYLLERFGLRLFDTIEPIPGIAPPPGRAGQLAGRMKEGGVRLVVCENFRSDRLTRKLAGGAGAGVAVIPSVAHEWKGARTYVEFMDRCVEELRRGFSER